MTRFAQHADISHWYSVSNKTKAKVLEVKYSQTTEDHCPWLEYYPEYAPKENCSRTPLHACTEGGKIQSGTRAGLVSHNSWALYTLAHSKQNSSGPILSIMVLLLYTCIFIILMLDVQD